MKLVTVDEMRGLERAAIEAGASEAQLMEEAGLAVAQEAWLMLGSLEGRRIAVLVGPGNNGGDGLVAARHLAEWGAEVQVLLPRERRDMSLAADFEERGITVAAPDTLDPASLTAFLSGSDLVVDALLGIGKQRTLDPVEPIALALDALAEARRSPSPPKLIAVDVPTGVDADSGAADPATVTPDLTVTFGLPKIGMYQSPASALVGRVQVIDIGIPRAAMDAVPLELMTSRWARMTLPLRPEDANKGTFGKLLVVGGSQRYIGAPRLAALGAYRAGAGLVTVAAAELLIPTLAAGIAEATWLPQAADEEGGLAGEAAIALRPRWREFRAAVVGPGLGDTESTRAFIWAALPDLGEDLDGFVLDADGLNALAEMPDGRDRLPPNAILTPHPGEMARLLGSTVVDVQGARLAAAREAAARFGCTVVLKGAHSVVAAADGRARLSPFANPLLASAGTGDILAGMIGAYLAQGLEAFEAACLGVYLHAATGEALRAEMGESGLLASDLGAKLPWVVKEIRTP